MGGFIIRGFEEIEIDKKTDSYGIGIKLECLICGTVKKIIFKDKDLMDKFCEDFKKNEIPDKYFCENCDIKRKSINMFKN